MSQPTDTHATPEASLSSPSAGTPVAKTREPRPYRAFFWGALIMAGVCFWIGTERLAIKRPTRADAYFITGILGILGGAMAWSLGAAHERARRSQQGLQDAVDRLQDRMQDMPRSLMEESVRVAEREAEGRRADQERQARELRESLQAGIQTGFAPLGPALSDRIAASLTGLSDALRQDREERAESLRAIGTTVAAMQTAQSEWAGASAALLDKLKAQGEALEAASAARDAAARTAWEELSNTTRAAWERQAASASEGARAALETQLERVTALTASLSERWEAALQAQREALAAEWRAALEESRARIESGEAALRQVVEAAAGTVRASGDDASARLGEASARAEEWLGKLSEAASSIGEAAEAMRRGGEEAAVHQSAGQAEWRATVEMFHQGMGGLLDRLQSLGSFTQGQTALLERMDEVIRSFEERSAELIEETALKAQESLLDALDQAGARDASQEPGQS